MTTSLLAALILGYVVAGIATTILVFQLRFWRLAQRNETAKAVGKEEFSACFGSLTTQLSGLESRLEAIEQNKEQHADWISQGESLQLSRRGQVLRLHRRGESIPDISSALRVGQGEVKLMVKVYELCRDLPAARQGTEQVADE